MTNLNMNNTVLRLVRDVHTIQTSLRRVVGNLPLFDISNENTPAALGADQNDYAIGNYDVLRLNPTADITITGFRGGLKGRFLRIFNVGSGEITIAHQSASSQAANRVITSAGLGSLIAPNEEIVLYYDATVQRWLTSYTTNANRISCLLRMSADQSIPNATYTELVWDDVVEDTGNFFDPAEPTIITFPETGLYSISAQVLWTVNENNFREINLQDSDLYYPAWDSRRAVEAGRTVVPISTTIYRLKGTTMRVQVWQNSDDSPSLDIDYSSTAGTFFTEFRAVKL